MKEEKLIMVAVTKGEGAVKDKERKCTTFISPRPLSWRTA